MRKLNLNVLLTERDDCLREDMAFMLEDLGCRVHTFKNGLEAAEYHRDNQHAVDLAILDLSMPAMGGAEAFRIMRARKPGLRAIIMTDGAYGEEIEGLLKAGVRVILRKPFMAAALTAALREAMAERPEARRLTCLPEAS